MEADDAVAHGLLEGRARGVAQVAGVSGTGGSAEWRRASPTVFESPFLDWFTRTHWLSPVLVLGPLASVLAVFGVRSAGWAAAGWAVAGYVAWTLAEYWIHRIAYHGSALARFGGRTQWLVHGIHHDHPDDPRRPATPPLTALPLLIAVVCAMWALGGTGPGLCAGAAFVAGSMSQELVHHHLHRGRPSTRLGRALRRHHLLHHYRDEGTRFGVTCPYWDYVFGTAGSRPGARDDLGG
ncbi:sterol desaturase family protein [Streptomyces sp. NPDC053048]|uniref:sterol desaturase family protein n=1 Tax=Streptomyces sp. NPDC053048 TaxID=3365694 RepID=UPI0037D74CB3